VKLLHGGWFPMLMALGVFSLMTTWRKGARWRYGELSKVRIKFEDFFTSLKLQPPARVKGTAVFMTQDSDGTPMALLHQLKHNQVLHEQVVLFSVDTRDVPWVNLESELDVRPLGQGFYRVIAPTGFMQTPDVPAILKVCANQGLHTQPMATTYYLGRQSLLTGGASKFARWRKLLFAFLSRNARSPTAFFNLPPNRVVELGVQIEL
jgi:KUP system potassium uptake protein